MGASVTGIDAVDKSITIARLHAALDPAVQARSQYRTVTAEQLVAEGATFDAVLSLEARRPRRRLAGFPGEPPHWLRRCSQQQVLRRGG